MRDIELLKISPSDLHNKYMAILLAGGVLTETQLIMMEAAKNMMDANNV